jgi:hypothetical protein
MTNRKKTMMNRSDKAENVCEMHSNRSVGLAIFLSFKYLFVRLLDLICFFSWLHSLDNNAETNANDAIFPTYPDTFSSTSSCRLPLIEVRWQIILQKRMPAKLLTLMINDKAKENTDDYLRFHLELWNIITRPLTDNIREIDMYGTCRCCSNVFFFIS